MYVLAIYIAGQPKLVCTIRGGTHQPHHSTAPYFSFPKMTSALIETPPQADASAQEIIDHLAQILQAVRYPVSNVKDKRALAVHRNGMLDALRVFTMTPFTQADEKWRTIASDPTAMAIVQELRDSANDYEYAHEVEYSDRIVRDIERESQGNRPCARTKVTLSRGAAC
jgi:hypothetical protein